MKDKKIKVKDMPDAYLYNFYMRIGEEKYFREMVLRLFEKHLK